MSTWRDCWSLGGDFNSVKGHEEKTRGKMRSEGGFRHFWNFIERMKMEEIGLKVKCGSGQIIEFEKVMLRKDLTGFLVHLYGS